MSVSTHCVTNMPPWNGQLKKSINAPFLTTSDYPN